jgi:probable F420-dependent oxidoreductase
LFSFMAGWTQRIGFIPEILILPQRQTSLVAKQAATLDVLSGGRLRLGVGLGWNAVEYTALGENFHNRGRRIEEQVQVLRQLFTQPLVNFSGQWHYIPDAGINPLPAQASIPIWFGGHADKVIERTARLGDGWLPTYRTPADAAPHFEKLSLKLSEAGRSPDRFGIEVRLYYGEGDPDSWIKLIHGWELAGATHCAFSTMGVGFTTPGQHIQAIRKFAQEIGLS